MKTTINPKEISQFDAMADDWWNENGKCKPLHELNPVRLSYLRDKICIHFKRDPNEHQPLKDLKIIDIGCGGGILCEPLARMGAIVTGVDASEKNITVAIDHAKSQGLKIKYIHTSAEDISQKRNRYDIVTALEIIEHVDHPDVFIKACSTLVKKDGLFFLSTLNRTAKSYALGIIAAEHLLRWVPVGTHDWHKFKKPSELATLLRDQNVSVTDICGLIYHPIKRLFELSPKDIAVNYLMTSVKKSSK